jgi:hypothetical protein
MQRYEKCIFVLNLNCDPHSGDHCFSFKRAIKHASKHLTPKGIFDVYVQVHLLDTSPGQLSFRSFNKVSWSLNNMIKRVLECQEEVYCELCLLLKMKGRVSLRRVSIISAIVTDALYGTQRVDRKLFFFFNFKRFVTPIQVLLTPIQLLVTPILVSQI